MMNQMVSYTAGRNARWFQIISAQFRESVDRTNAVFQDLGAPPNQLPDYLTMMANLFSPKGWQRSLPQPPWRLEYEDRIQFSNIKKYKSCMLAGKRFHAITKFAEIAGDTSSVFLPASRTG